MSCKALNVSISLQSKIMTTNQAAFGEMGRAQGWKGIVCQQGLIFLIFPIFSSDRSSLYYSVLVLLVLLVLLVHRQLFEIFIQPNTTVSQ